MKNCEKCNAVDESNSPFCSQCGTPFPVVVKDADALRAEIKALRAELESVEDTIEIQSFGFYQPRYGFEDSKQYTARLKIIRSQQKDMIRSKEATECPKNFVVDGSLKKGRVMMEEQSKLMLRAFNGDCDAAITRVKFDNVTKLETRIKKAFTTINKLGATKKVSIAEGYFERKVSELYLIHEHREKIYEEKELEREIKEQMREDRKAEEEIVKIQKEAEKEEIKYSKELEKARRELQAATGEQHDRLEALIEKLQQELSAAIDRKVKSISRAQLTKSGHVYVLSNIGSLGEGIYKIGMTRRFEPLERVRELGGASVPFRFDVHAMMYSENAPALEAALHRELNYAKVNKVNTRKEYFRTSLDEIHTAVKKHFGTITFVTEPAAIDFRKSLAFEEKMGS